jgi:hypothetical protein
MRLVPAAMALLLVGCPGRPGPQSAASVTLCREGTVPLLGACVDPAVGDAWCGPAARMSSSGACVFRECAANEALDLDGSCVPLGLVVRTGPACPAGAALVVASRHTACIPADNACPRGSRLQGPPGEPKCVTGRVAGEGPRNDNGTIDIGAWAAGVLGPSGGPGAPDTCRPLAQRPDLFGLTPGQALTVRLSVRVSVPDEDLSRAYAEVQTHPGLPPAAESLVRAAISTSLAGLRSRPAQASAGVVDLEVTCTVRSL